VLTLLDSPMVRANQDFHLQAFKALIGSIHVISGDNSLGHQSLMDLVEFDRIQECLNQVILSASKSYFYSDDMTMEYFNCLLSLVGQNTEAFISNIGIEFLLNFTLKQQQSENAHTVSGKI
jgi:hypothetical protein